MKNKQKEIGIEENHLRNKQQLKEMKKTTKRNKK